jgi:RNA polymerase sigma-70 factor (ECF subfamily)
VSAIEPDVLAGCAGISDEQLVVRVRAGERALYEVLMRRCNERLYRAVRSILRDEHDVEDVLQDAYLSAYRHLGEFAGRARFSTWMIRIAINHALDRRRRSARSIPFDPAREDGFARRIAAADPEQLSGVREVARRLENEIDALPEPFRTVYMLREVEGLDTADVATSLGISANTVKTRLHRARLLLRVRMQREVAAYAPGAFRFGAERCDRTVAAVLGRIARAA